MAHETSDRRLARLQPLLSTRAALNSAMVNDRRIAAAVQQGTLVRVARGRFVAGEAWWRLSAEDRHLLTILAVRSRLGPEDVFCRTSAAAIHGLPVYRFRASTVHLMTLGDSRRSRAMRSVARHADRLDPEEVTTVAGLRCTTLTRTALDIARTAPPEVALGCADAALRARSRPGSDPAGVGPTRAHLLSALGTMPGARGVRAARTVLELADPRAESPLESASRWFLTRLGFDTELQVPVPSPNGGTYWVDLELSGLGILCEVDGRTKYIASAVGGDRGAGDRAVERALYAEKRRQDWITGVTEKRLIRWGHLELDSIGTFASMLRSFGVRIPSDPFG